MSKKKQRKWNQWESTDSHFDEGGQSKLYLVKNNLTKSDEIFVLKELKNPKRIIRFEREINAIIKLESHDNVIQIVDYGIFRDEKNPCYVMPKADCSLAIHISKLKEDINQSLKTFEFICAGVEHLHISGIIHRDLKPENILIFSGIPKISDFGLCLVVDEIRITPTSEAVGSRFYMAPELEDGKNLDIDPSADVYSLGKILYYILSGGTIFSREKFRNRDYSLTKKYNDPRFEIFSEMFSRSISVNKSERYSDASEFRHEFKKVVDKFICHPRTKVLIKLGPLQTILKQEYEPSLLSNFTEEEWNELVGLYLSYRMPPPIEVFDQGVENINERNIDNFIILLIGNETYLGEDNLIRISGNILAKNKSKEIHFGIIPKDIVSRFLSYALENETNTIYDSVAQINMFTLQQHKHIISKLAKSFAKLSVESKQSFLITSYRIDYEDKLVLLNTLLDINNLDEISFEAVIAGICFMNDLQSLERIAAIGDNLEDKDKIGAFGRGILLGSSIQIPSIFKTYDWKNPLLKVFLKLLNETDTNINEDLTE